ncbi:MAG: hypothetical protein N2380_03615 [bacterium]|nr:hypothetical protein [bacterium]
MNRTLLVKADIDRLLKTLYRSVEFRLLKSSEVEPFLERVIVRLKSEYPASIDRIIDEHIEALGQKAKEFFSDTFIEKMNKDLDEFLALVENGRIDEKELIAKLSAFTVYYTFSLVYIYYLILLVENIERQKGIDLSKVSGISLSIDDNIALWIEYLYDFLNDRFTYNKPIQVKEIEKNGILIFLEMFLLAFLN